MFKKFKHALIGVLLLWDQHLIFHKVGVKTTVNLLQD